MTQRKELTPMIRSYFLIYVSLLALLFASVAEYEWHLLPLPLIVAFTIALVKAALVAWFFMELDSSATLVRWTVLAGLFWIGLLFGMTALDVGFRTASI